MNPAINLIHLKFFCDAVTYESISEAAKMNYISQSAVSQAITKLEAQFGVQLFIYNRQKLQVTNEGKVVFEQAKEIFRSVRETFEKVNQTKEEITGFFKFVTTKSLGMSFLPGTYKRIKETLPLLDFSFRMGGLNLIRTALKREEAEFAIVVYDSNFDQFEKLPLMKGRFHLYQAENSSPDCIENGIFIDEFDGLYINAIKEATGLPIKPLAGWDLVARFASLGMGVGFFPDYIRLSNRYTNIAPHPLEIPPFEYEICAVYNKGTVLSKGARLFLDHFTFDAP